MRGCPRLARAALVSLGLLLLPGGGIFVGGCTYYPTVLDAGGVRLRPTQARAVRAKEGGDALVYFLVHSTGKYGDVLKGVDAPVAQKAELRSVRGWALRSVDIPGRSVVKFHEGGPRVVLTGLTRPLTPGEVFVMTLHFEKSGALGLVTVVE
jgi:copper(I)-binding protein